MSLLGINLTLLLGPTVALPAPFELMEVLDGVEVNYSEQGRSGFQLTFQAGRNGPVALMDYGLMMSPLLKVFNRVIIMVTLNAIPKVLMDGIITNRQFAPGNGSGGTLTVTGEDVSVMMDREEKNVEHPAQDETIIVNKILLSYFQYGFVPIVIPPTSLDVPIPTEKTPVQRGTDLAYINQLAQRYRYVFYVTPGPVPFTNNVYWGPPKRIDVPQRAITVNMGADTNCESINFQHDGLSAAVVSGKVQEPKLNKSLPVQTFTSLRPPLSSLPALPLELANAKKTLLGDTEGLSYLQALARAQAQTDESTENVLSASGELNALRYGGFLQPRGVVGLRGAGFMHDGLYYVKRVNHNIKKGAYKQSFSLSRDGLGSITPVVMP
jgi:hypothetical protein